MVLTRSRARQPSLIHKIKVQDNIQMLMMDLRMIAILDTMTQKGTTELSLRTILHIGMSSCHSLEKVVLVLQSNA